MSVQAYAAKARQHWAKWLPKKTAALKASGTLDQEIQAVAKQAQQQVLGLMQQGFRQHEAEEVALHELILLPPETDAAMEPWERKELASLESEYQSR